MKSIKIGNKIRANSYWLASETARGNCIKILQTKRIVVGYLVKIPNSKKSNFKSLDILGVFDNIDGDKVYYKEFEYFPIIACDDNGTVWNFDNKPSCYKFFNISKGQLTKALDKGVAIDGICFDEKIM